MQSLKLTAIALAATATLVIGASFVNAVVHADKIINPNINGSEAVGIIIQTGAHIDTLLANFVVNVGVQSCNGDIASTTDTLCPFQFVSYQGNPVRVYFIAPLRMDGGSGPLWRNVNVFTYSDGSVGPFPFGGFLFYEKELTNPEIEAKLIQMMESNGNASYTIIYEP